MKPRELYERKPESVSNDLKILKGCYYDHIFELNLEDGLIEQIDNNEKIQIKYYKYHSFDSRRIWSLASVWFDGSPVMIIQNAGREGDDHHAKFVTDEIKYIEMLQYINELLPKHTYNVKDFYGEDQDIPNLTNFYGNELDGYFEYHW